MYLACQGVLSGKPRAVIENAESWLSLPGNQLMALMAADDRIPLDLYLITQFLHYVTGPLDGVSYQTITMENQRAGWFTATLTGGDYARSSLHNLKHLYTYDFLAKGGRNGSYNPSPM
jgi:hypothetical protein